MSRRWWSITVALVACIVAAILIPPAVRASGERGPAVGTVIRTESSDRTWTAPARRIHLPPLDLIVRAGAPQAAEESQRIETGDRRFVPVSVDLDGYYLPQGAQQPEISVVAGGRRVRLEKKWPQVTSASRPPDDIGEGLDFYVVAPDEGRDVQLEVTYDGLTQTLDLATGRLDAGVAQGLAEAMRLNVPCRTDRADVSSFLSCSTSVRISPYDADLGWVEDPGERYVVVTSWSPAYVPSIRVNRNGRVREYGVTSAVIGARLDGSSPMSGRDRRSRIVWPQRAGSEHRNSVYATYVFEVKAGVTARLDVSYDLTLRRVAKRGGDALDPRSAPLRIDRVNTAEVTVR